MPKVSDAHRETQRAEILEAARLCFAENGFHATSMQEILEASGKSAGAVYGYFGAKSEIVAEIAHQNVASVLEAFETCAATRPEWSLADAVVAAAERLRSQHAEQHTAEIALQVWAEAARDPELLSRLATTHRRFRAAVVALILRRHPDRTDAEALAAAVTTLLPGYIVRLATLGDDEGLFEAGVRSLLSGL